MQAPKTKPKLMGRSARQTLICSSMGLPADGNCLPPSFKDYLSLSPGGFIEKLLLPGSLSTEDVSESGVMCKYSRRRTGERYEKRKT